MILAGLLLGLCALAPRPAQGLDVQFQTIADNTTVVPGNPFPLLQFIPPTGLLPNAPHASPPSIGGGAVAFFGGAPGFIPGGIYLKAIEPIAPGDPVIPPTPAKIVTAPGTVIPDFGLFNVLRGGPFNSGMNVLFLGGRSGLQGVFLGPANPFTPPDPIRPLVNQSTPVPGGGGATFSSGFGLNGSVDGTDVAFLGDAIGGLEGIYAMLDGSLGIVADTNTLIPGFGGNFTSFNALTPIRILNRTVAFIGNGPGLTGVYLRNLAPSGPFSVVADSHTPLPGGLGFLLNTFTSVSYDGANVAFVGGINPLNPEPLGVYQATVQEATQQTLSIRRVADILTPAPGGGGLFLGFGHAVTDGGLVVFEGLTDSGNPALPRHGLYLDYGGQQAKIVATGDTIGGKVLTKLSFGPQGFADRENVVFAAAFDDGTQAVLLARICLLQFDGFQSPLGGADATGGSAANPLRTFSAKATIPLKMRLADCNGAPLVTGAHTLQVIPWTSPSQYGAALDAVATNTPVSPDNAFRLTAAHKGEWQFNLDPRATGMTPGVWELRVTLGDGTVHSAFIALK